MGIVSSGDNDEHIVGGTDQTTIGNVADSLKVNVTNLPATQPVSGTVAATQSGTWTVQPGNTANTTAWKVDGSAVTQPVSAASLPLPTGASTEASLAKLTLAQNSATTGETGPLVQGAVTSAAPAYTTGQTSPVSLTTAGAVRTDASATTQPISGSVTANQGGAWNITNVSGTVSLPTGAATSSLQTTGNTSLASLVTNTSSLTLAQGSTTSGQTGALTLAAVTTGSPSYTTGQTDALSLTPAGALRTDSSAVTQPVSGTVTALPGVATADTYGAAIVDLVTGSVPQDIFTITGSGTRTVYIWEIRVSGNTGSPAEDFYILKRSTANSGGTSTTLTAVPYDSLSAAATATVRAYTANPTSPGTLVGHVRAANINIKQPQQQIWSVSFGVGSTMPMVLRGTSEVLAINANGVAITGSAMVLSITWTEV